MKFEEMVAIKVRMIEVNSITAIIVGVIFLLAGVAALVAAYIKDKSESYSDAPVPLTVFGCLAGIFSILVMGSGIYNLVTAELQARASLAKYALIELLK